MKKQMSILLFIAFLFLSGSAISANVVRNSQQASDTTQMQKNHKMNGMMHMKINSKNAAKNHMSNKSIVRKGMINVEALDKNKDGKLYEDIMDWNVISDKPGTCPLCGMKLREMTIQQVKHNLKEHGFKYE